MNNANKIRLLPPSIAERIAAGEVIERPANLVKELLENSLDAGATEIVVKLEEGGKALIEVQDNGHGMPPEDLELCTERHATSKLSSLEDLEKISTLGFRGEALASIATVSDLSLLSRAKDSDVAHEIHLGGNSGRPQRRIKAEVVTFGRFIHSTHGTRIRARGLFSQIPARLKFMKSQSAEVAHVREWIERLALAFPQVGFQFFSDGRTVLTLRPQDEKARIRAILSDGEDFPILTTTDEHDPFKEPGLQIRIHWLQGLSCSNSRKLIQVVNSRAVRDKVLQQALLAPFRQMLLPGQFPALVLFMDIHPASIDVNIHPTKTEIRFLETQKIFRGIDALIKGLISREGSPAIVPSQLQRDEWGIPTSGPEQNSGPGLSPTRATGESISRSDTSWASSPLFSSTSPPKRSLPSFPSLWEAAESPLPQFGSSPRFESSFPPPVEGGPDGHLHSPSNSSSPSANPLTSGRLIGVLFQTYWLYEKGPELILVDQHAAHERIRYEKLKKSLFDSSGSRQALSSQALLIPETIRFLSAQKESPGVGLEEGLKWLSRCGFETQLSGEGEIVFSSIPSEWGTRDLRPRLNNLMDRILSLEKTEDLMVLDERLFETLASEACHSAVRAGDLLNPEVMNDLVQQLMQCENPWNCPHGRPSIVKLPRSKLEEWFQRKT